MTSDNKIQDREKLIVKLYEYLEAGKIIAPDSEAHRDISALVPRIRDSQDIVVLINHSLDEYPIEFIQQLECAIDKALGSVGFTRSVTSKGDGVQKLVYYQFAFCQREAL